MIEKITPGTETRLRILTAIYEEPGINITNLIKKSRTSPNIVLKYTNSLRDFGIIEEEKSITNKKIHLRKIKPNLKNNLARTIFSLIENNKKILFFKEYKELKAKFEQLNELVDKNINFIIIYGSFARFAATKDSDLDILIAGKPNKEKISRIREIFITLKQEPSIKIETLSQFKKNLNKPLYQNIIRDHVVVYGEESFLSLL